MWKWRITCTYVLLASFVGLLPKQEILYGKKSMDTWPSHFLAAVGFPVYATSVQWVSGQRSSSPASANHVLMDRSCTGRWHAGTGLSSWTGPVKGIGNACNMYNIQGFYICILAALWEQFVENPQMGLAV